MSAPSSTASLASAPPDVALRDDTSRGRALRTLLGVLRLCLGWIFFWPFLDKLFGLGFATPSERAWLNGGSPTAGFLGNAVKGPFADFYGSFAGAAWADWLFMVGLGAIGLALLLGIGVNVAAVSGALLLFLMWTAVLPPENNPFLDDHLVYGLVLIALAVAGAGRYLGLGRWWQRQPAVAHRTWLH